MARVGGGGAVPTISRGAVSARPSIGSVRIGIESGRSVAIPASALRKTSYSTRESTVNKSSFKPKSGFLKFQMKIQYQFTHEQNIPQLMQNHLTIPG
jgi:hypothetical protein